jgi:membrane-associated phospholipid phosphatase
MKKYKFNLYLIFILIFNFLSFNTVAFASDGLKDKKTVWQNLGDDIMISLKDAGAYCIAPLHFTGKDWLYTGAILGGTALIMTTDKEVRTQLGRNTSVSINHNFWDGPYYYGHGLVAGLFSGGVYAAGLFSRSDNLRVTGRLMLQSIAYSGCFVLALKVVTGRGRPYISESQWNFKGFKIKDDYMSFSSNHAAFAFAMSTVLSQRIGNVWASIGLYGIAGLTAISRVVNNQHWLSDVVLGSVIGMGAGYFVIRQENDREHKPGHGSDGLSIYPSMNGLNVVWKF